MRARPHLPMLLAALLPALPCLAARAADAPLSPADQVRQMQRGINIVGFDPLWTDPAQARFKQKHFQVIRQGGFSAVRMALVAFQFMNRDHELPASWFATLDKLVAGALAQHLTVIIDEHDYNDCGKDVVTCRPKLMAFWTQVARHFQDAPDKVVFEILNEPNDSANAVWNDMLTQALGIIRRTNPTRNVIIGPGLWNNPGWLDKLVLPPGDRHIIVTVHYYDPTRFTFQGITWMPDFAKLSGISWGSPADHAALERDFDSVQRWSKAHDRPILVGEFGAYDKAPMASRAQYLAAVARAAEQRGFAWACWQFAGDFVVYDVNKEQWLAPLHSALIPGQ